MSTEEVITCDECENTIKDGEDSIHVHELGIYSKAHSDACDSQLGDVDFCSTKCMSTYIDRELSAPNPTPFNVDVPA